MSSLGEKHNTIPLYGDDEPGLDTYASATTSSTCFDAANTHVLEADMNTSGLDTSKEQQTGIVPNVHDKQPCMPTSMAAPMDADAYNITSCNSSGR